MNKTTDIQDYFLIGDLHTAALVSNKASIDWLCLPHFDDPSIFAKLLDPKAGSYSVDTKDYDVQSSYVKDTAILEFKFKNAKSEFLLRDFMVPEPINKTNTHFLIRKFWGTRGKSDVSITFSPKLEYGVESFVSDSSLEKYIPRDEAVLSVAPSLIFKTESDVLLLYLPKGAHVSNKNGKYKIDFTLEKDEMKQIILEYTSHFESLGKLSKTFEKETAEFWRDWVSKGKFFDFARDRLVRSAITLKLMQFYPTGALVAAPTTSLPENIGGVRNWDYRYVWIRDATFTLYAFYVLGYKEEARKFFDYIHNITTKSRKKNFELSFFYTIGGKPVPDERTLDYFEGYKNSKPVRIGNGANKQFQLDVFGALIDAHYFMSKREIKISKSDKDQIINLAYDIEKNWMRKDNGIWEVRVIRKHFTYSKVMAWVGINRLLRMKNKLDLNKAQIRHFEKLEKEIVDWIWANCYDEHKKTFLQHPDAPLQDGTNFLFVLLQFLDKHDPRTQEIIDNTQKELSVEDVFVYRYLGNDGLPRTEGAFLLCTFWLISALAIIEDIEKAKKLFKLFEKSMPESALFSEEMDPFTKEYLGNFPQAFSHLGYIMTAYYIDKYGKRVKSSG